jgi:hypothetical protein
MNDDRLKQIMTDLGQPNSNSLYQALKQVANEVEQEVRYSICKEICWDLKEKVFDDVDL